MLGSCWPGLEPLRTGRRHLGQKRKPKQRTVLSANLPFFLFISSTPAYRTPWTMVRGEQAVGCSVMSRKCNPGFLSQLQLYIHSIAPCVQDCSQDQSRLLRVNSLTLCGSEIKGVAAIVRHHASEVVICSNRAERTETNWRTTSSRCADRSSAGGSVKAHKNEGPMPRFRLDQCSTRARGKCAAPGAWLPSVCKVPRAWARVQTSNSESGQPQSRRRSTTIFPSSQPFSPREACPVRGPIRELSAAP